MAMATGVKIAADSFEKLTALNPPYPPDALKACDMISESLENIITLVEPGAQAARKLPPKPSCRLDYMPNLLPLTERETERMMKMGYTPGEHVDLNAMLNAMLDQVENLKEQFAQDVIISEDMNNARELLCLRLRYDVSALPLCEWESAAKKEVAAYMDLDDMVYYKLVTTVIEIIKAYTSLSSKNNVKFACDNLIKSLE